MLKQKTKKYLNRRCRRLEGKTVIITGANSGIGFKAAEELIFLGAKIIMACRSLPKAQAARTALLREYPGAEIEIRLLDLAAKASIEAFAEGLIQDKIDIYAFVGNAGIFRIKGKTAEGEDLVMGTNYTGTRLLAEALLPYLESLPHEVRMTFTTSIAYIFGDRSASADGADMSALGVYATSKLRLTKYAFALSEKLVRKGSNAAVFITHPGITITPIADKAFSKSFMRIAHLLGRLIMQSPERSALAIPFVLSGDAEAGNIYGPDGLFGVWGYPDKSRRRPR